MKLVSGSGYVFHWIGFLLILHATSKDVCNKEERICKGISTRTEEISFLYFFFFSTGVQHFMNIMINAIDENGPTQRYWKLKEEKNNFLRKIGFST